MVITVIRRKEIKNVPCTRQVKKVHSLYKFVHLLLIKIFLSQLASKGNQLHLTKRREAQRNGKDANKEREEM